MINDCFTVAVTRNDEEWSTSRIQMRAHITYCEFAEIIDLIDDGNRK